MATLRRRIGEESDPKSILIIGGSPSPTGASGVSIRLFSKKGPVLAKGVNLEFRGNGLALSEASADAIRYEAGRNNMNPKHTVTLINRTLATMPSIDST